jgi:integrase
MRRLGRGANMANKRDFTDRFLKSIKAAEKGERKVIYDGQIPGFGIRVTDHCTNDHKGAFVLITRFPGSSNPAPRRIGDYPAMPLVKAREIAREWREDIRQGVDPKEKAAEAAREQQRLKANTFGAAFASFANDHLKTLRTGAAVEAAVKNHVFPTLESRPMREIRRSEILSVINKLKKGSPIGANRVLAYLKKFFVWALESELVDDSPAASIRRPTAEKDRERDRVLADWEMRAIWRACGEMGAFGRAFKFMLATGQRRSEVGGATWGEIDKKESLWTLGKARTKAKRLHDVPLSDLALSIIVDCPKIGDFLFASGRSGVAHDSEDVGPVPLAGWGKAKERLDELVLTHAKAFARADGEEEPDEIEEWRLHDLRRTAATHMARLGVDRLVIGKVLNHAEGGVTMRYDRHRYDGEKRQALQLWGERLSVIVAGTDAPSKVGAFTKAKA